MAGVPLVDLRAQHRQIATEVRRGFARVIARSAFVSGEEIADFETAFAGFCGVPHCVAVANGTDALELALRAIGVGPGDEVILPANTFIATALAVVRAGAVPALVDCDPHTHLIDVQQVRARLGARTRAIIAVHLYGQIAPMDELQRLAQGAGVALLEDAAQAHGARRHGVGAGGFGAAAGISFYPSKNLGAYGDGGAVLTPSATIAAAVRALRSYGSERRHEHPEPGFNSRLDTLQAVVLRAKLAHLAIWNEARRRAARRYDELLDGMPDVGLPVTLPGNEHVWHLYVVRVPRRDRVLASLNASGVGAGVHYPTPIHLQGAFRHLGHQRGDFPQAEAAAAEVLSLPLFPEITPAQQRRVVAALRKARC